MRPFVHPLTRTEIESPAFWTLLHEAAGVADDALRHIRDTELPALEVIGVTDGDVVAFAAFAVTADELTLEYIAVDAGTRGRGIGASLVDAIRSTYCWSPASRRDRQRRCGLLPGPRLHRRATTTRPPLARSSAIPLHTRREQCLSKRRQRAACQTDSASIAALFEPAVDDVPDRDAGDGEAQQNGQSA